MASVPLARPEAGLLCESGYQTAVLGRRTTQTSKGNHDAPSSFGFGRSHRFCILLRPRKRHASGPELGSRPGLQYRRNSRGLWSGPVSQPLGPVRAAALQLRLLEPTLARLLFPGAGTAVATL